MVSAIIVKAVKFSIALKKIKMHPRVAFVQQYNSIEPTLPAHKVQVFIKKFGIPQHDVIQFRFLNTPLSSTI